MSDATPPDRKALIRRVEELARNQSQSPDEVPLLTEVVEGPPPAGPRIAPDELEQLARRIEAQVMAEIAPSLDRVEQSAKAALEAAHAAMKEELAESVRRAVREALAPLGQ